MVRHLDTWQSTLNGFFRVIKNSTPPLTRDDLFTPFVESHTPRGRWVIGTEAEKFGVFPSGAPLRFTDEVGTELVLTEFTKRFGWTASQSGGAPSLKRGRASITLEPGSQLELSGSPLDTIHQTHIEFAGHRAECRAIGQDLGITWLGLGYHPFARQEDLDWIPKNRYQVMKDYLLTRGSRARDMMRRTCTVQANLDYESEADAMRKLRLALKATPIVTSLFANSAMSVDGNARYGERTAVWSDVDPDRTGFLPFAWKQDASYEDYIEWALDAPMFLIARADKSILNTGQTFRDFFENGFEGHRPTLTDWDEHLTTLFPEVRLKRTLELRSTDSQSLSMVCALPALWKGLLYDEQASQTLEAVLSELSFEQVKTAQQAIPNQASTAQLAGRSLREWGQELVDIAKRGLERLGNINGDGQSETIFLEPLIKLDGVSPAELWLEKMGNNPSLEDILEAGAF